MDVKLIREVLRYPWEDEYLHAQYIYLFLEDLFERQAKCNINNNTKLTAAQKRLKHKILQNQPIVVVRVRGNSVFKLQTMNYLSDDDSLCCFLRNLPRLLEAKKLTYNVVPFPDLEMQITYLAPSEDVMEHRRTLD